MFCLILEINVRFALELHSTSMEWVMDATLNQFVIIPFGYNLHFFPFLFSFVLLLIYFLLFLNVLLIFDTRARFVLELHNTSMKLVIDVALN